MCRIQKMMVQSKERAWNTSWCWYSVARLLKMNKQCKDDEWEEKHVTIFFFHNSKVISLVRVWISLGFLLLTWILLCAANGHQGIWGCITSAHINPCTLAILAKPKDINIRFWGDTFETINVAEVLHESNAKLRKIIMQKLAFYVSILPYKIWKTNCTQVEINFLTEQLTTLAKNIHA